MKTRIFLFIESLKTSFWFIPALMICAAIIISFAMVMLDRDLSIKASQRLYGFMLSVSPQGARTILSTIAGSMMTVAGVTFSITIVVLNLASSQFGPRLLRNFIEDRGIQFVLGTFVSSFIYCLLVLRSVESLEKVTFVPSYSVTFSVVLAFLNVAVLIYFIHHIATSIQADEVITRISRELQACFKRIFTEELDSDSTYSTKPLAELQKENMAHFYTHTVSAHSSGYLQAIYFDKLLQLAKKNDLLVHVQIKAGQFVLVGSNLAIVSSSDKAAVEEFDQAVRKTFIIGRMRTSKQDAEYSIHQLVEIAVRALSPGINDPYTAIECINQLGTALQLLGDKEFSLESVFDDKGKLRLLIKPFTYAGILNASFDQIRQYGSTSVAVTVRLLEVLIIIAAQTGRLDQRKAIHRQADMILRTSREMLQERDDKEDVLERYRSLLTVLNTFDDQAGPYAAPEGLHTSTAGHNNEIG